MNDAPNADQAEFWSGGAGRDWIAFESQLDALFGGANKALIKQAQPQTGQNILDVGCGTGATTRDFAQIIGPKGHALGLDISTLMLAQARETATAQGVKNVTFTCADAQITPLADSTYNHIISRFGVMFFADPVAAFTNLHNSLISDGHLTMACWGPFKENPWFTLPRRIATDLLGSPPSVNPRDPGPFAFADTDYTLGILTNAGFSAAKVDTLDIPLVLPGDAANAAALSSYIGPADSVIRAQGGTPQDKAKIVAITQTQLKPFEINGTVTVPSKIHLYSARKSG